MNAATETKTIKRPATGLRIHCTVHKGTAGTFYVIPSVYAPAGGRDLVGQGKTFESREDADAYKARVDGQYADVSAVLTALA